ncbi:MAG: VanW family protein [Candidatus Saccharimonadaceae bacterium]|nr:VanW family protein [Candidatus Saccharimonadaceae bacterium]
MKKILIILVLLILVLSSIGCDDVDLLNDNNSKQTSFAPTNTTTTSISPVNTKPKEVIKEELIASYKMILPNEPGTFNAGIAATYLNNHVIKSGEIFSFNKVVGERTPDKGYVKGSLPYRDTQGNIVMSKEYGSGVCRASDLAATLFIKAGLQLVEMNQHDIRPGYFDMNPGLADATVYWDQNLDNRFKNNKDYDVKIKMWLNKMDSKLYGELYRLTYSD